MPRTSMCFVLALCLCLGMATAFPIPTAWCSWFSYDAAVDTAGYCHISDNYLTTIPAEPTSWVAKTLTRAYGRGFLCSEYSTNATCSAQAASLSCSWDGTQCSSTEVQQWSYFSSHAYLSETPAAYLCPGSQAQQFRTCNVIGIDSAQCASTQGCAVGPAAQNGVCQAAFMANMTQAENTAWFAKFQAFDPSVHGSCASTCYLKQIFQCSNNKDAATCGANPYCQYSSTNSICSFNLYGSDAWGTAATKASTLCGTYGSSSTCRGPIGAVINTKRINTYKNWTQAGDASLKNATCPL